MAEDMFCKEDTINWCCCNWLWLMDTQEALKMDTLFILMVELLDLLEEFQWI